VRRTVPPSAEIEAQIDQLLAVGVGENPRESLSELAKLGARLIIQRAVEDELDAWLGRARYERRPDYQRGRPEPRSAVQRQAERARRWTAFTPDSSRIVFTRCCPVNSGYGLWSIRSDGTGLRLLPTETVGPAVDGPSDNLPQVSPDGRTIAFHRDFGSLDPENRIVTVNMAGGHLRQPTDPSMDAQIPNWSPDGRRIVFQALGNIWAVSPDGTDLTQLTFEPDSTPSFAPSYSPDGTEIIFHRASASGQRDLYTMNPDGTGVTQLTRTPASERFPQWAPAR
jgi:Tol biopolymer transport system component